MIRSKSQGSFSAKSDFCKAKYNYTEFFFSNFFFFDEIHVEITAICDIIFPKKLSGGEKYDYIQSCWQKVFQ